MMLAEYSNVLTRALFVCHLIAEVIKWQILLIALSEGLQQKVEWVQMPTRLFYVLSFNIDVGLCLYSFSSNMASRASCMFETGLISAPSVFFI
jgi:hypothetical protein